MFKFAEYIRYPFNLCAVYLAKLQLYFDLAKKVELLTQVLKNGSSNPLDFWDLTDG